MKIYQRFWVQVGDDWTKEDIISYVLQGDNITFLIEPDLEELPEFLVLVSEFYPEATIIFNTASPGETMVLGQGIYGENTYGEKQ